MSKPFLPEKVTDRQLAIMGCFFAFSTGIFLAAPTLSPLIGLFSIIVALVYCGVICLIGRSAIWLAISLTAVVIVIFAIVTNTAISVISFAVFGTISLNFFIFGFLGVSLKEKMSLRKVWLVTAGTFAGSLGFGWLLIPVLKLIFS